MRKASAQCGRVGQSVLLIQQRPFITRFIIADIRYTITASCVAIRPVFELTKNTHTSPLRASYGVSFVSILKKNDRVIKGLYCTYIQLK